VGSSILLLLAGIIDEKLSKLLPSSLKAASAVGSGDWTMLLGYAFIG
jgi:hypothetical protein